MPSWCRISSRVHVTVPSEDPGRPITLAVTGLRDTQIGRVCWSSLIPPPAYSSCAHGPFVQMRLVYVQGWRLHGFSGHLSQVAIRSPLDLLISTLARPNSSDSPCMSCTPAANQFGGSPVAGVAVVCPVSLS